jgi:spermidine/putrescine ABC transporter ATP-binding subunit
VGDKLSQTLELRFEKSFAGEARVGKVSPQRGQPLDIEGTVKRYDAVTALAGVDLGVAAGEILTLLGPSGSGKTTLLKIVAGYERPDSGRVRIGGNDITSVPPGKRDIGMVFQSYALFPHMTVGENIAFPLEMRRQPKAQIRARVDWALETIGLRGFEQRRPGQLSGGQQQRVALARAVVFEPRLLLLDEPFGALDKKLREMMQLEVKALQRRLGLTTVFVTHDQEEALVLSDRIAVMNNGAIEQVGTPAEVYSRPANRFVAEFIGDSNIFELAVDRIDGERAHARADGPAAPEVVVPARLDGRTLKPGARIMAVLRPEAIALGSPAEAAENIASGEVLDAVFVGDAVKCRVRTAGGVTLLAKFPFMRLSGRGIEPGAQVNLAWRADAVHWVPRA